ncbi:MAG: hypothetical protein L6Q97_00905, partial [Thermoanaerobaculia bacterium]|nr:hypothetical protein [Thermoanaerobaculia bacterium]
MVQRLHSLAQQTNRFSVRLLALFCAMFFFGQVQGNNPCSATDLGDIDKCNGFDVFSNLPLDGAGGTTFPLMGAPCQAVKPGGDVAWYKFTMPVGVNVIRWQLITNNAAYQLYYTTNGGCANGDLAFIECGDDFNSNMFIANPTPNSATTFYIAVYEDQVGLEEIKFNIKMQGCPCMDPNIAVTVTPTSACLINPGDPLVITASGPFTAGTTMGEPDQYSFLLKIGDEIVDQVTGTTGTGTVSHMWTVNPLVNTTYTVCFVRSDGCLDCENVVVTVGNCCPVQPTITLGANPTVCQGDIMANLPYTATTGSPNQYKIDFDAAAEAQGFVDVAYAALPLTPIVLSVPGGAAEGTYNGTIMVRNSANPTCESVAVPFTVTIQGPEIAVSCNSTNISDGDATPVSGDCTDFGCLDVSTGMQEYTFTITNTASCPLDLN